MADEKAGLQQGPGQTKWQLFQPKHLHQAPILKSRPTSKMALIQAQLSTLIDTYFPGQAPHIVTDVHQPQCQVACVDFTQRTMIPTCLPCLAENCVPAIQGGWEVLVLPAGKQGHPSVFDWMNCLPWTRNIVNLNKSVTKPPQGPCKSWPTFAYLTGQFLHCHSILHKGTLGMETFLHS